MVALRTSEGSSHDVWRNVLYTHSTTDRLKATAVFLSFDRGIYIPQEGVQPPPSCVTPVGSSS